MGLRLVMRRLSSARDWRKHPGGLNMLVWLTAEGPDLPGWLPQVHLIGDRLQARTIQEALGDARRLAVTL